MNLREIILGVTVFVLTLFVTIYGVNMLFSEPIYEDYCGSALWKVSEINESVCFELGGKWNPTNAPNGELTGFCDQDFNCRQNYDLAKERYSMNLFLIAVPFGILLILFGAYFFSLNAVGVGIMAGGVGTILRGVGSYWRYSEDWIRFLISLFGLIVVIYFSYNFSEKLNFTKNFTRNRKK
jgi:hypothetical protein